MFSKFFLSCLLFILWGCGSSQKPYKIAVDPSWYPLNFEERQNNILGFTNELLLAISSERDLPISLLQVNWDTLFEGLQKKEYPAILSSLYPYNFNEDIYSFSEIFLHIGPVIIVPKGSVAHSLKQLEGFEVGVLAGSSDILLLEKYPNILIRTYESIPTTLNDLLSGNIQAAILPILPASAFIQNLYYKSLTISSKPLTEQGLRLITLKNENPALIKAFNKALDHLKNSGEYDLLLQKWNLPNKS